MNEGFIKRGNRYAGDEQGGFRKRKCWNHISALDRIIRKHQLRQCKPSALFMVLGQG